jgi:hypothetical protein
MDQMLDNDQGRRAILELFALIDADVHPRLTATGTQSLRLGQFVMQSPARQVRGQASATVWPGTPLGLGGVLGSGGLGCVLRRCVLGWDLGQVAEQRQLVGIEAFALAAVDAFEQPIQALTQSFFIALFFTQGDDQFHDHPLKGARVVG